MTGDSVSATKPETTTAAASVIANSRNSEPVSPPWNAIGAYTVASVMVMAMIGPRNSRAPTSAASMRDLPWRTCRSTFSTTTMASSTTRPTDSTIARMVSRFRLNPNASMTMAAPMSDTGIATSGTSAVRTEPMNRNTTMRDDQHRLDSVLVISVSACVMNIVPSQTRRMSMSCGSVGRMRSISSRSACATSISFEPGSGQMPRYTACLSLYFAIIAGLFGAELDARDVAQPHDRAVAIGDDQVLEFLAARRSVFASRLTCTRLPLVWPTAAR